MEHHCARDLRFVRNQELTGTRRGPKKKGPVSGATRAKTLWRPPSGIPALLLLNGAFCPPALLNQTTP